jgi:hypothetical protein
MDVDEVSVNLALDSASATSRKCTSACPIISYEENPKDPELPV